MENSNIIKMRVTTPQEILKILLAYTKVNIRKPFRLES